MKKIIKSLSAGMLMSALCAGVVACNNSKNSQDPEQQGEDVPFSVYSPAGEISGEEFSAQWVNLDYGNGQDSKIIVINSDEELQNYIEGDYPAIDFSKNTLLIAYGATPRGFHKAKVDTFSLTGDNRYRLDVIALLYDTTVIDHWSIAIVVNKIEDNSDILLNVKFPDTWPE
jgi:hypothetical protein